MSRLSRHLSEGEALAQMALDADPANIALCRRVSQFMADATDLRRREWVQEPFVFDADYAAGFVYIGQMPEPEVVPRPDLAGLDDFITIAQLGNLANAVMTAQRLLGDGTKEPGGALRHRLRKLAAWADDISPTVADIIGSIKVGNTGSIDYTPPTRPRLLLSMPR